MKQKTARIISLGMIMVLFASLFSWPQPVNAGVSEWSAETTPGITGNVIGPANVDICDFAVGDDEKTIYAVPGNSITANVTYKSIDAGVSWTAIPISIRADIVTIAPDDNNLVVIANNSTPEVRLSNDGGVNWYRLGNTGEPAAAAILDISISPVKNGIHYIAAAGYEAGNIANIWYYRYGITAAVWEETNITTTGFIAQSDAAAIAFSPLFASDTVLLAVTSNTSAGVKLQVLDFNNLKWNDAADFPGYPCTVVPAATAAGLTGLISASLTLSPNYDGQDDDYRDLFIGLAIAGDATAVAASGIYRFRDTTKESILLNKQIHSVAFNGTYVIAGSYNDTSVYRIQNPLYSAWTIKTSTTTKNPGGDNKVLAAWLGSSVAAGTAGNESAFAISKDSGNTFNDISLIDTTVTFARDVAVPVNAAKVYYVTDDGLDTSLWYKTSGVWKRVLSLKGTTNCIVRVERQTASAVYVGVKGATTIYYNSSSGGAQWQIRNCNILIQDIAVESAQVIYALNGAGKNSKSTDAGNYWDTAADTNLNSGGMLYSISANKLLATSQDGYAAYSMNGTASWKLISPSFNPAGGKIHVIPDQNFATNNIIYAASETAGQNIMKWQIGVSTAWTDIFNGAIAGGVYGLAIDSNTLYALEYNTITNQSTLWRFITPTAATATSTDWVAITTTATTDIDNANVRLDATPQGLKSSTGKLWAVKTNGVNKLYSLSDSVTDITLVLDKPEDGYSVNINSFTGFSDDVAFTWARPSVATEYELRIYLDPDFSLLIASIIIASTEDTVFVLVGPHQTGARNVNFMPGSIYHWRIRTTKPGYSLYSDSRSFIIEPVILTAGLGLEILGPKNGAMISDTTPAFSWQPLSGATEYEFVLSESVDFSSPLLDAKVEVAGIQIFRTLESGKTYFWRVRSTSPIMSDWSTIGNFIVKEYVPQVVTTPEPLTETIEIPAPTQAEILFPPPEEPVTGTPGYLIFAIFIAGILAASVIILIFVRHPIRLFSAVRMPELSGFFRGTKETVKKTVAPREKPIPHKAATKPAGPPVVKPAVPTAAKQQAGPPGETTPPPLAARKSKEAEDVIFAAKSFMWLADAENKPAGPAAELSAKERDAMGKKLAARIHQLAKKELLYIRHPEDAASLLQIWARHDSRNQTTRYLADSFKDRPDNAIKFIKCYLSPGITPEAGEPAAGLTRDSYTAMTQVIDTDKVYAALAKVFKFKLDSIEEKMPVRPDDRNIAFKFMRLHLQKKT